MLAAPLAERGLSDRPEEIFLDQVLAMLPLQPRACGHGTVGLGPSDGTHPGEMRRVDIRVVKNDLRVVADGALEVARIAAQWHGDTAPLNPSILRQFKLCLDDDSERAVDADAAIKEFGILHGAGIDHITVRQHYPDAPHR